MGRREECPSRELRVRSVTSRCCPSTWALVRRRPGPHRRAEGGRGGGGEPPPSLASQQLALTIEAPTAQADPPVKRGWAYVIGLLWR